MSARLQNISIMTKFSWTLSVKTSQIKSFWSQLDGGEVWPDGLIFSIFGHLQH